ncbi:MAG: hypothetical protein JWQ90_167 [Hydrocarboniphaga sp.]|uniref:Calx-beta domain-containing protein n=1 Tax=Hydrocarboniphaga sp. TaxID=2033016 RepID=UPI00260F7673|nr:Calx-beta domain-containing protein [Hydrocarboniphaga sp.]MDB5967717.1 hypothetical protein [Hydrocarboniphaga sp.]
MIIKMSVSGLACMTLFASLFATTAVVAAPTVVPPFDSSYQISTIAESGGVDPVPGVPSPYGGLAFRDGDPDTLLMVGHAYTTDAGGSAAIYAIGVSRDADGHINGFVDNATLRALGPGYTDPARGAGTGLAYSPDALLFYASNGDSSLGQIKPGSTAPDKQINLAALVPASVVEGGPLIFVPQGFAGAGKLKMAGYNGDFYRLSLAADGVGTYEVSKVDDVGMLAGSGTNASGSYNRPTGFGYVAAGNPQFTETGLLATQCDFNTGDSQLFAYDITSKGDPQLASARSMVSNLCATGAVIDPVTGDMLFTNYYGFPALTVLSGFTVPPPTVAFVSATSSISETKGTATISVKRLGSTASAVTVKYSSSAGTAVNGTNYSDVSGTLSWAAGEAGNKSFSVPVVSDGVYNDKLTVKLKLSKPVGAALGAPASAKLSIVNKDPLPTVAFSAASSVVTEGSLGAGVAVPAVLVSLSSASGKSISVPVTLSSGSDSRVSLTSPVTIPAGQTQVYAVSVADDASAQSTVKLTFKLGTPSDAALGTQATTTLKIKNNDP